MHIAIDELFSLKGKVCVVTGGSRGIGRGCADFIAAAGADIALISTTQQAAEAAAACLREEYGVKSIGLGCLVQDREAVFQAMDRIEEELGTPQLLFNNAGICDNGDSESFPEHTWRSILDVNLTGAFFVMQAFAKKTDHQGAFRVRRMHHLYEHYCYLHAAARIGIQCFKSGVKNALSFPRR